MIPRGRSIRITDAAKLGFDLQTLRKAAAKKELRRNLAGWLEKDDLLLWATGYLPRAKAKKKLKAAIDALKKSGGTASPAAPAPKKGKRKQANGADNLVDEDWLERLAAFEIDGDLLAKAEQLNSMVKARHSQILGEEKHLRILREAGRLADVRECTQFVSRLIAGVIEKIKKMPETLDAEAAKQAGINADQARAALGQAREYLLGAVREEVSTLEEEAARFEAETAARFTKPGRR